MGAYAANQDRTETDQASLAFYPLFRSPHLDCRDQQSHDKDEPAKPIPDDGSIPSLLRQITQ